MKCSIKKLKTLFRLVEEKHLTNKDAAFYANYSPAQFYQIRQRYKKEGDDAFVHGNKGKPSNNKKIPEEIKKKVVDLYLSEEYRDEKGEGLQFAYFLDWIKEFEDIHISYTSLYRTLIDAGIESPEARDRKDKETKVHRPRARKEHEGELVQYDATPYQWFLWAGDTTYYALHGGIDDATSKITALYGSKNECLYGYIEVINETSSEEGIPMSAYTDRSSIFCKTQKKDLTLEEQLAGEKESKTQWQRMLNELSVSQILARSPQAKGRIERLWKTVQKRLPPLLKKYNIRTLKELNDFLPIYKELHNRRFAVKAKSDVKLWQETPKNIDFVLCAKEKRRANNAKIVSFMGVKMFITMPHCASSDVILHINEKGIFTERNGVAYPVEILDKYGQVSDAASDSLKNIIYAYMHRETKDERMTA